MTINIRRFVLGVLSVNVLMAVVFLILASLPALVAVPIYHSVIPGQIIGWHWPVIEDPLLRDLVLLSLVSAVWSFIMAITLILWALHSLPK